MAFSCKDYLGSEKNFFHFQSSKLLRRGIERELEIIGEATNRILKINPDIAINEARRIVDLRNWIIHGYDRVDDVIIWGIISKDIPALQSQIDDLLS